MKNACRVVVLLAGTFAVAVPSYAGLEEEVTEARKMVSEDGGMGETDKSPLSVPSVGTELKKDATDKKGPGSPSTDVIGWIFVGAAFIFAAQGHLGGGLIMLAIGGLALIAGGAAKGQ